MHATKRESLIVTLLAVTSLGAVSQDTRLIEAARSADLTKVGALLEQRVDVNATQADGATALHWAAHWDDDGMADALIRAGAAVDVRRLRDRACPCRTIGSAGPGDL